MAIEPSAVHRAGSAPHDVVPLPPVLVAEDDAQSRAVFVRLLAKLGIANPVRFAPDGQEAIDYLAAVAAGSEPVPVLIVLDLNMPRRSGLDVLRWLRERRMFGRIPVVMLTGSAEMGDVTESHQLGVASYLVKPVGFGALSDVIRRLDLRWGLLPAERA
ncbi:MAG: response regulator [Actinomycetota bacterium]